MTLQQEKDLLSALTFAKWLWLVLGTGALLIGALTSHALAWLAPMIIAAFATLAETWQARRVRKLESGQR